MTAAVTVDMTRFERGMAELEHGLERVNVDTARRHAEQTARAIAAGVPVRTGALRSSVAVVAAGAGYGVTYGRGLRYAWPQEKRTHAVNSQLDGASREFHREVETAAAKVVNRL